MKSMPIVPLCELVDGQEADTFALLTGKEEATTREGKPYFRVSFRDAQREVSFPIWNDSAFFADCRDAWRPGCFYKVRAVYRETNYGPQLDISRIRETDDRDRLDGFDPLMCQPSSRRDPHKMHEELAAIAQEQIGDPSLAAFTVGILQRYREQLIDLPAATHNHHAYRGGYLEHVLSVVRNACFLADKYASDFAHLEPPLERDLVVAGAVLHDIGKLRELEMRAAGPAYRAEGELIGHILLGRDLLREAAAKHPLDPETLLRLEHIIVSHQRLPEWGSPKPPMTLEALLVHYADDVDAKFQMMVEALNADHSGGAFTSKKNALRQKIFRGLPGE